MLDLLVLILSILAVIHLLMKATSAYASRPVRAEVKEKWKDL